MEIIHSSSLEMSDIFIGDCLYINSENLNSCLDYLIKNNIKNVAINSELNYRLNNLSFLQTFGKYISGILIETKIDDISELKNYTDIETIFINENFNTELDLSIFKNLKYVGITFGNKIINLDKCYNLEHLTIFDFSLNDLRIVSGLPKLRYLKLSNSKKIESLNGIDKCQNLNRIELLYLSKLTDISKIHLLNGLRRLLIINCKKN